MYFCIASDLGLPLNPVPAGINLPIITFSLRPSNLSSVPRTAELIRILVVCWNDAADKNPPRLKATSVIPIINGTAFASISPFSLAILFFSFNSATLTISLFEKSVSPFVFTFTLENICLIITSICFLDMDAPCNSYIFPIS